MIWVIGGTSEGEFFSKKLGDIPHIVTLGTKEGLNYYEGDNYQFNRMDYEQMRNFIKSENIDFVVDLSHPFAINVSHDAKRACRDECVEYHRFDRDVTEFGKNTIEFANYEECFEYLESFQGSVFITTGSNRVEDFEKIKGNNRFIYRVLPMVESITKLINLNIHIKDIVAMVGPFTKDLDIEMYKFLGVDCVVMKDSGDAGGTSEKIKACEELGIKSFVITRTKEKGVDFNRFVEDILKMIK